MTSIRARLLASLLGLLALAALLMGAVAYRNVLAEAETIFDYQLQQMALSLRDQGEIDPAEASTLADEQLDVVIQIWTVDGRAIYASRPHASLPARALLGLATLNVDGRAWRTYGVATRERGDRRRQQQRQHAAPRGVRGEPLADLDRLRDLDHPVARRDAVRAPGAAVDGERRQAEQRALRQRRVRPGR
ncbi:MAG TPA: sensor histidine kinase N-terminal domain-containing protein, partial [Planctomycetota bacterium]|nr:sensor histidine kinase N-terminal domain-containing protein [Planctomycetota bacterium]